MKYLLLLIIPIIYGAFNWPWIEKKRPIQMIKEGIEDQSKFALTEIPKGTQIVDKTIQNDLIINNIPMLIDKKTVL